MSVAGLGFARSGKKGVRRYQVGCPSALVARDFLEGALDLEQVQGLALDLDGGFQDRLDFAEFVDVACYEVDKVSGCCRCRHFVSSLLVSWRGRVIGVVPGKCTQCLQQGRRFMQVTFVVGSREGLIDVGPIVTRCSCVVDVVLALEYIRLGSSCITTTKGS